MSKVQAAKAIIGALESGVKVCTQEGRQMAKGVRLARPGINHTIATIDTKKGTKVVETVKNIRQTDKDGFSSSLFSTKHPGKWQEITEADGMVTTTWRGPKLTNYYREIPYTGITPRGWRKEFPDGRVEQFMDGGGAVYFENGDFQKYPKEVSYMLRDNEGRSLIAIRNANGLTIRAKDIELENGLKLNGHYYTKYPSSRCFEEMVDSRGGAIAPKGTDKGILYEVFTTVNKFLDGLRKPAG